MDHDRTGTGGGGRVPPARTRRQLLTGAATGAAGAIAAQAVFGAGPAYAGTDGDVVLGQSNTSPDTTLIEGTTDGGTAFWASAASSGIGVRGGSSSGAGVRGDGAPGVHGLTSTPGSSGVEGDVVGTVSANGVYGHARNPDASGVCGQNDGTGYGVAGRANNGTGVLSRPRSTTRRARRRRCPRSLPAPGRPAGPSCHRPVSARRGVCRK